MAKIIDDERALTYLEAMIVVIIIGLFSAMALPALENLVARERLKSTARTVTIHLREARHLAIAKEQNIRVVFTTMDTYGDREKANVYRIQEDTNVLEKTTLPDGIIFRNASFKGNPYLTFNPLGTATAGRVVLENNRGDTFYVIVNSLGRVRTSNVPPENL